MNISEVGLNNILDQKFEDYRIDELIGAGTYGSVYKALEISTKKLFAVKKIPKAFENFTSAKRTFREIKILKNLNHDNVISLHKWIKPTKEQSNANSGLDQDVFIVLDLMETDLHRIIYSAQVLTESHVKYFFYQLTRGLKYIHEAKIVHRDLKPSNILVNSNCTLKIGGEFFV